MNVSPAGVAFTQAFEDCKLVAYQDQAGVWTCGWGSTGDDIDADTVWTQDQADARFMASVGQYEDAVNRITVLLSQEQFDALFDFSYNEGGSALLHSTLVNHIENGGDLAGLFEEWDKVRVDGALVVSRGLLRRRQAEDNLFTNGDYGVKQ